MDLTDIRNSPVFILGLPRSGTTLLYEMLAASGCFNILTARHVICFDELRYGWLDRKQSWERVHERFEQLGLATRGVDIIRISPDTPEEYGWILDNLHAGPMITKRRFHVFRSVCEVIQRDSGRERRLLLKNPWDLRNGRLIKALIPGAKIVYIHRNPFHVLSSLYRLNIVAATHPSAYLAMLSERYASFLESDFQVRAARVLVEKCPGLLAQWLICQASWLTSGYLRSLSSVPREDRIDVKYETLCGRPNETIEAILCKFNFDGRSVDYRTMIGRRASSVSPEVEAQRDLIVRRLSGYAASVGYDLTELAERLC